MADIQFFSCDNGLSDICFRMLDGFSHGVSFGQISSNGRGEGTPGSMQVMAFSGQCNTVLKKFLTAFFSLPFSCLLKSGVLPFF